MANSQEDNNSDEIPWAMIFPDSGTLDFRHPSQLYQAFGEGLVLFVILYVADKQKKGWFYISNLSDFLRYYPFITEFLESRIRLSVY